MSRSGLVFTEALYHFIRFSVPLSILPPPSLSHYAEVSDDLEGRLLPLTSWLLVFAQFPHPSVFALLSNL